MINVRGLAVLALLLSVGVAWGAGPSEQMRSMCIERINERTAAFVTRDWPALERMAEEYLKACKGAFNADSYSTAYEHIAIASLGRDDAKKGLLASDACIRTFYSNSGCHIQRVVALIKLNHLAEARVSLDRAEKLVGHGKDISQRDLERARASSERELHEARLDNFNAQQSHVAALRERYFAN